MLEDGANRPDLGGPDAGSDRKGAGQRPAPILRNWSRSGLNHVHDLERPRVHHQDLVADADAVNRVAAKISQTKKAGEMRRPRFEMQG